MRLFRVHGRTFLMEVAPNLLVPADLDDYMVAWCFIGALKTDKSFQLSHSFIQPGDTVIDIGANIGLWLLSVVGRAGPTADIHAFEPVPANFDRLTSNLDLNRLKGVKCCRLALSDHCGTTTFYAASNGNSGGAALTRRSGIDQPITTNLETLDNYCAEQNIERVDFIKIDVEGGELLVFQGGKKLLSSEEAPILFFEVSKPLSASFDSSPLRVKSLLNSYGYQFFRYNGKNLERVEVNEDHEHEDLFAFKPFRLQRHPLGREVLNR